MESEKIVILGINGPIGSGKNEVANILEKNWGFKAVGFADKLKESAAALFDIDPKEWEHIKNNPSARVSIQWSETFQDDGQWIREKSFTGREFLKRYGTEAHRDVFWDSFWVDVFFRSYSNDIAVYDARFDNELRKIKEMGGVNIQVRRQGHEFDPSHPSETAPNEKLIDYVVMNNSSLEDLEDAVNLLVTGEKLASPALLDDSNILAPLI